MSNVENVMSDLTNEECTLGMSGKLLLSDDGLTGADDGIFSSEVSLGSAILLTSLRSPKMLDMTDSGDG